MGRGKATYRKRDLRVARECAKPGDNIVVKPDGTITIVTGKAGEASIVPPVQPNGGADEGEWDNI